MLTKEPEWIFPFTAMDIGDSFFIPTLTPATLIFSIESGAKRAGIRVKCYTMKKEDVMGVRTWRIG